MKGNKLCVLWLNWQKDSRKMIIESEAFSLDLFYAYWVLEVTGKKKWIITF